MNEQDYILIVDYIDGQLSAADKAAFEQRLATDIDLQKNLAEQQLLVSAVGVFGKVKLKSQLNTIHAKAVDNKTFKKYKPSKTPSTFSLGRLIQWLLLLFFLLLLISGLLIYFDKFPVDHPYIDKVKQELIAIDSLEYEPIYPITNPVIYESYAVETLYQEVVVPAGSGIGTGTIIYEDELDGKSIEEYLENNK